MQIPVFKGICILKYIILLINNRFADTEDSKSIKFNLLVNNMFLVDSYF